MPGAILNASAVVLCAHSGKATPTIPEPRVKVAGQPVATLATRYSVAGCTLPPSSGGPCVTGQWKTGATRVRAMGRLVAIATGRAVCTPTGQPLRPQSVQQRVTAS